MSWIFYQRGTVFPYLANVPLTAVYKNKLHPLGTKHPSVFYINEDERVYWAWQEDGLKKMWKKMLTILDSSRRARAYFSKLDNDISVALYSAARIRKLDLKKVDNYSLLNFFNRLENDVMPAHFTMNSEIDVIDLYLEDYLRSQVKSKLRCLELDQVDLIYERLISQVHRTYVNKQEIAVIRAALSKDLSDTTIKSIYSRFWWTSLGWENMKPHSLNYFRKLVKQQSSRSDLAKELKHALNFISRNLRLRRRCLKQYSLGARIEHWLWVYDRYVFYHDRRKEVQVKTIYSFYLLLLEVARRFNLSINDLIWLWHKEVKDILCGRSVNLRKVVKRKRGIAALVCYNKFEVWSGSEVIRLRRQHVKEKKQLSMEIKGMGINKKIVLGRIKVCVGFKDAGIKIKNGDILVCPMTTPDYVPFMKKAKAIITNEGGITCHAAIIARELKIPCIVGTKTATQFFKDGDRVEVDSSKGVARIIKKN